MRDTRHPEEAALSTVITNRHDYNNVRYVYKLVSIISTQNVHVYENQMLSNGREYQIVRFDCHSFCHFFITFEAREKEEWLLC